MKDVMVDLECLGKNESKVICQIGAVYFDRVTGELGQELKINVDAISHEKLGGRLDADTVYWWLSQSKEAQQSILAEPRVDIVTALHTLNDFLEPAARIWSHATFDFVTITATMRALNIRPKFKYQAGLDLRTLTYLAGTSIDKVKRTGLHHDALDDCRHQVKYAVAAITAIKGDRNIIQSLKKLIE